MKLTLVTHVDLGLAQILPMFDEETGAEPKIISASFGDPYLLLVRDDASICIVKCDESNELEEMERGDVLLATKWLSGCLYKDTYGVFARSPANERPDASENTFMFLMSAEGGLHVCNRFLQALDSSVLISFRFLRYLISQNLYMLLKDCLTSLQHSLPITSLGDWQYERLCPRS